MAKALPLCFTIKRILHQRHHHRCPRNHVRCRGGIQAQHLRARTKHRRYPLILDLLDHGAPRNLSIGIISKFSEETWATPFDQYYASRCPSTSYYRAIAWIDAAGSAEDGSELAKIENAAWTGHNVDVDLQTSVIVKPIRSTTIGSHCRGY